MARTRMSWDWVEGIRVFVYTTFLDHNTFKVKLTKGDFDAGPNDPAWKEYTSTGIASKDDVVSAALIKAKEWLIDEREATKNDE